MAQRFGPDSIAVLEIFSVTQVKLPPSQVTIGGQQYRNDVDLFMDITTSGAGGLDTGSVAASTTYRLYAIVDALSMKLIASLAEDDVGPTGFSTFKFLGQFSTNVQSEIVEIETEIDKFVLG